MRQLYKDQSQSLSNVMNLMTGMTGRGAAMGGISTAFNTFSLGSEIVGTNKSLDEAREEQRVMRLSGQSMDPAFEVTWKKINRRIERLIEVRTEQREKLGVFGGFGGKGEEDSKWAKRLEPIMSWAKKNKSGIIISAASIGMMYMVFKKLLSVSPMLQKMLEVMGLAFNLVLRPFGDFIGFILRPIAMNMLALVMPFFKEAYPFLMKLGSAMGEKFAVGDILGALGLMFEAIHPFDVLKWIFGDREGNTEGGIGAVGAVLSAGVLGLFSAVVLSIYKMTGWVRAFLGLKPIPTVTPTPTTTTTSIMTSTQPSSSSGGSPKDLRGVNWRDGKISGSYYPWQTTPQPNQKVNQLQSIKNTIDDVIKNLKFGKLNSLASIRGGSGGTAFMISQLLDNVPIFKENKLELWKWWRDMDGRNDPSNAWKGIDQYGQGIGVPDYSQKYPFAHNVDSTGTPINININIDNVENSSDVDYLMNEMVQEMESSNYMQAGN